MQQVGRRVIAARGIARAARATSRAQHVAGADRRVRRDAMHGQSRDAREDRLDVGGLVSRIA